MAVHVCAGVWVQALRAVCSHAALTIATIPAATDECVATAAARDARSAVVAPSVSVSVPPCVGYCADAWCERAHMCTQRNTFECRCHLPPAHTASDMRMHADHGLDFYCGGHCLACATSVAGVRLRAA